MQFVDPDSIPRTGNAVLDLHHRALAASINALYERWKNWESDESADHGLLDVLKAVEDHFAAEEIICRGANFRGWRRHEVLHDALRDRMRLVTEAATDPNTLPNAPIEAFTFFDELIFEHEFLEDQEFWESLHRFEVPPGQRELIRWGPALEIGEPERDHLHAGLVDLLNASYAAIVDRRAPDSVVTSVGVFRNMAESHFFGECESDGIVSPDLQDQARTGLAVVAAELGQGMDRALDAADLAPLERTLVDLTRFWVLDHILNQHCAPV